MFRKNQRYSFRRGLPPKYLNAKLFSLKYGENDNKGARCAVVVGKKIDKKATVRNKLKRRFIHALEEVLVDKSLPYDLVFFLKKEVIDLGFQDIKEEIKMVFQKGNIISKVNIK